ncbi:tripartite motif-containing protein 72-like [Saccostrea cucullata]|uniref:tripartite motif-containing protein 72-like n=1 Tax=Saccostrea cuccullata TaxID=36930 RepID=UPI002ED0F63E
MDPRYCAQDIIRCDLCERNVVQSHCELCHVNLCKACVGEHLSDSTKRHRVVPYKEKISTPNNPKCPKHSKNCELYCEQCDIPVCSTCISSGNHRGHHLSDVLQKLSSKSKDIEEELKELETKIYPKYEEIASEIKAKKESLEPHYRKLTTAVTKQGEDWHREINVIVNKKKSEIDEMKSKHLAALNKQENEIKQITAEVDQCIVDMKKILDSNDVSLTSGYKSRNTEFRSLPPKVNVSLPAFSPHQINTEQLAQMFGSLSALSIKTEEHGYTMKTLEDISSPPVKPLLDEPKLITTIDTGRKKLCSVTCLSDEEIWTCGGDKIMKLINLQGKLLKSIQTKSGYIPHNIAVTRSGDLVYSDDDTRTVNIVKNKQIQELIRLQGWIPYCVCSTSSGDLLITMYSDDDKQSKVVRYSGSTETQTIQFDSKGKPLYSSSNYAKYISENRNLDICVADNGAHAVVVVNQAGKFRFRYTVYSSTNKRSFDPLGITTDSQSQILTADSYNNCIHILNQDGQFLRYIDNCDLYFPFGLCVDTKDNLFVAECERGKLKKIRYM